MLEKLLENRPSVATLRRKARLPEQKCCELKFSKLNLLVIICRWADTLWALGGHKEKDWFGLAARRVVRSGELVGDLQGGRGRRKKAKKSCGTARGPQSYPCTGQDPTRNLFVPNEAFCRADIIVWGKRAPKDVFVLCGADAVFFWGTHLTHVVFTFCSTVQFLWTRLSLERGGRILILPSTSLVTWEVEKRRKKELAVIWPAMFACCGIVGLGLYLQDCWAQLKSLLTICSNSGYQKNTKTN